MKTVVVITHISLCLESVIILTIRVHFGAENRNIKVL